MRFTLDDCLDFPTNSLTSNSKVSGRVALFDHECVDNPDGRCQSRVEVQG